MTEAIHPFPGEAVASLTQAGDVHVDCLPLHSRRLFR
jgi:hypothetical protein